MNHAPRQHTSYEVRGHTAVIALNRPEARNSYTLTMADEIAASLAEAEADADVRVIVLTANGKDFCVGADLSSGSLSVTEEGADESWVEPATRVTRPLHLLKKPVVAAVFGAAVGVGSTMILPADIRICADDTRFGFVFARRGIYPEGGSTWFLPRIVGLGRASEWMLTGRLINADEALAAGLVSRVAPREEVFAVAMELAEEIATNVAPVSASVIRMSLQRGSAAESPEATFVLDSRLIDSCSTNPDTAEGVTSFLERRPADFSGKVPADLPDFLPW